MSKNKAIRVDHLCDLPLDKPGMFLRIERRHWADGSSCLHIAKWGIQPHSGKPAPWWPQQYTQVPWDLAERPDLIRESPLLDRARGPFTPTHWLAHIGITTVLLPPAQGNTGDGSICQPLGDIKPGGGSKSGRRRKKPRKKAASLGQLEPWGA